MQLARCAVDVSDEGFCRDEFGIDEPCAHLSANQPERRVGNVFHRGEHDRAWPKVEVCYFHLVNP
jgi:hypothetical protein